MDRLVNCVGIYLLEKNVLKKDDVDVFTYGLDLILFSLISILGLLALGFISGNLTETILCLGAFIPLQVTGGGYHAKTHLRCFLTMMTGWCAAMIICHTLPVWAVALFMLHGTATVFRYAPIEHVNAPMSEGQRRKMYRYSRGFSTALTLTAIALFAIQPSASIAIAAGLGMSGVSMNTVYHLKKRTETNMQIL